ncbi:MAG: glycosyltransferase family 9 protein [Planctomycetes bacterium]|nr:glycosyltransferase family 9 protein [Planctomycetota bacterium]
MANSIQSLQRLDRRFGPAAHLLMQPLRLFRRELPESTKRILVMKFWGLGSITLLGPALRVLRRRHPEASIDLLTLSGNVEYAKRLGGFDNILSLTLGNSLFGTSIGILRMLREVRARRYDQLYDFEFLTHFSALVAQLSRARWTAGYSAPEVWRGGFFDEAVPYNRYWHVARNARSLAGGENGLDVTYSELIRPTPTDDGRAEAARALADGPVAAHRPIVIINVNAGQLALERRWPAENFVSLLNHLTADSRASLRNDVANGDLRIIMIGSREEREYVEGIRLKTISTDLIDNFAGKLSIDGLLGLLERAAIVVSNDSGPLHIAAALDRPVVALFGPETPVMYAPLASKLSIFYRPPACSPCINVHDNKLATCHLGHPLCLERIAPDDVYATILAMLAPVLKPSGSRRAP